VVFALAAVTLATFASPWWGHDRVLTVTRDGRAHELVLDSCCHRVVELRFRITRPRGTGRDARATATVVSVHVFDGSQFTRARPAPRVGQTATLRLRAGMLVEPLSHNVYCRPSRTGCGA
jgi:hypothetical protein